MASSRGYSGKPTTSGNSKALRFESALFKAHPEFARGELVAHVLGPGTMLVKATPDARTGEGDPVLDAYLSFLETHLAAHPEEIRPMTAADVRGLDQLLAGVVVDRDEEIPEEFELP